MTSVGRDERETFLDLLRHDFPFFIQRCFATLHPGAPYDDNWHIEAMAAQLDAAMAGRVRRLLITMPPRHMKSLCVSVAWVAFLLGYDPTLRIMLVSYGQLLSDNNLRLLRLVLESDWYQEAFPGTTLSSTTQMALTTSENGSVRAMSTGGVITGFGADYIIYDDPIKQSDAQSVVERDRVLNFYRGALVTRQNDARSGRIVIVMQRVHEEDLAAHVAASGEYQVLCLPAEAHQISEHQLYYGGIHRRTPGDLLWEERFPKSILEERRREMGDYEYALQYQQDPIPQGGGLIRIGEIRRHAITPAREDCQMVVQSIDTGMSDAPTADYTALLTFGYHEEAWRLLDVQRHRLRWPALLDLVRAQQLHWRPDVLLIEHAASGIPLLHELQSGWRAQRQKNWPSWRLVAYRPLCGKLERFVSQSAKLRDGFATIPAEASWLAELLREIAAFPHGRFDDQVDALSQFIDYASRIGDPARIGERPLGNTRPPGRPLGRARAS